MSQEVETRAIVDDQSLIRSRLIANGFIESPQLQQVDSMLDLPDGSLFRSGQKIRLRSEGDRVELTYKGHFQGDESFSRRVEINVPLYSDQVEPFRQLLGALGYPELFRIPKSRSKLTRGDVQVTFDEWPIIGCLMEAEGPEGQVRSLLQDVCPDVEFRNFRLKELFELTAQREGRSIADLQSQYEAEHDVRLGRLDLMLG